MVGKPAASRTCANGDEIKGFQTVRKLQLSEFDSNLFACMESTKSDLETHECDLVVWGIP
jgi:hypothetical protein